MLSVNILTWNTWPTLHETLHILANELKDIESEVIIVDNGSTDGCQDVATIKNEKNLGISKGKNQGIRASKGDYILLLDGDIVPVPNSIRCLYEYMLANKEVLALGFYGNKFSNRKDATVETFCNALWEPMDIRQSNKHGKGSHCVYFGMYHKSVFEKCMFDEDYPVNLQGAGYGWEDLDFYMQMEEHGIAQYVAGINHKCGKYYHAINSSIRQMGFQEYMRTSLKRGQYFNKKWPGVGAIA